jgi:hypothetical protein
MDDGTRNSASSAERIEPESYPESFARQDASPTFNAVLRRLGHTGTHRQIMRLFPGAAHFQIRDWRNGRRLAPRWAWDRLGQLLDIEVAKANDVLARLRALPPAAGRGSHNNIAKWNARRFAEKKKPGV